ncbi:MAG: 16S rRNA (guanine(527)-N(7))-methyltransferase RsmG [Porticoccus sp.]|nr:16S rRNA (guanine(527)-N(7))-methyltransferase RsmG [Porticoccus sp.]MBQ0808251.1 16S rRNA (guanine(527)-N(7))-methyltransferase RsmG [Porticoccus sp.]
MQQKLASKDLEPILREGLQQLSLMLSDRQVSQLLDYLGLLEKWNGAYNLTSIREPEQMLRLHLLDSLSIAPLVKGERIIDVGTGPGLPGIPLAIIYPERQFTLLDSNGKKTRFLFQVRTQLGLDNVTENQSRVEAYQPTRLFDGVTSRAFTSLKDMVEKCAHLIGENGRFYAMKGQYPAKELSALPKHYNVVASHQLQVPGVDRERHLIEIAPS